MKSSAIGLVFMIFLNFFVFYGSTPQAQAATGDLVASVTFSIDCGTGVGIAFDGANLWYSCAFGVSPNLHRADPTTGIVTASYTIPVTGSLGALSYDATRNVIWAGAEADAVWRIDLDAGKNVVGSALVFNTGDVCGLDDGLAFDARNVADPNDDVIYYSDDCFTTVIDVYDLTGTLVESFAVPAGFGAHNSGLGIGGQLLYEADLFNQLIWVIDKTTKAVQFTFSSAVAGDPNFHSEDLECDTKTFAGIGKHVMWSKEAFSPARAHAFEIPFGSCGIGGQPEEPEITLDPPTDVNDTGTNHTVEATITVGGAPVPNEQVSFSVVSGPNAGQISDPGECAIDPNCNTDASGQTSWTYTSNGAVGTDVIQACFTDDNDKERCAEAQKEWVDRTPPKAACTESVNPHGDKIPPAGKSTPPGTNPNSGVNEDGFYHLTAEDNSGLPVAIFIENTSGSASFGPFSSSTTVKITEAPGAAPNSKPMGSGNGEADAVAAHITLDSDAVMVAVDAAGNTTSISCFVPPPPK